MAKSNALNLNLPSADDLFRSSDERQDDNKERVQQIELSLIDPFADHPFKVVQDEEMEQLAESVRQYGIQMPIILRPKEDGRFELVSGHRRKLACELAGLEAVVYSLNMGLQNKEKDL